MSLHSLEYRTGASQSRVRFSSMNPVACESLSLEAGAAEFRVTGLANANCRRVRFDGGVGEVTLDFSGRPYAVFQGEWTLPSVGGLPNTLFAHFLESFAQAARCNLHAHILYGRDDHHKAEALFKALGRAADAAVRIDPRRAGKVPSSKGVLA